MYIARASQLVTEENSAERDEGKKSSLFDFDIIFPQHNRAVNVNAIP
jgi:hypothetical protein